ncbi:hypothetical protein [Streptomyces sp. 3N207]|uniref:hypothetical protein n=1 Tax=Streptomyces sp. 3N207 TaxID=3457417 RepID=UPI003FD2484B
MSTLVLLVVQLLLLVGLMAVGVLGCAVSRHPVLTAPLTVALAGATLLTAEVSTVATAAAR